MPNLTILNLTPGDSQQDIINKVNANFDALVSNGGGPEGPQGSIGEPGAIGPIGPKGDPGQQGTRGTKWFVDLSEPTGGPGNEILEGDYWIDSTDNSIYVFTSGGWVDTGDDLQAEELFSVVTGISGPTGNRNAIVFSGAFPSNQTLVLSDSISSTSTANPTYSKLLISTNGNNDFPILEFAKTNAVGVGTPADFNRHPQFRWLNPATQNYNLLFSVPQDTFTLRAGGNLSLTSTSSSVNINGSSGVNITSGSALNVNANSGMTFSAGTSLMTFTSQNFNISSTEFTSTIPFSVTSSTTGFAFSVINNSASGNGLIVTTSSTSSSNFLMNLSSGGTSRFFVRGDGKTFATKISTTFSQYTSSSPNFNVTYFGGTQISFFTIGTNLVTGNTLVTNLTPTGGGYVRSLAIPVGGTAANSWTSLLANNESIQIRIMSSGATNTIRAIGAQTGATAPLEAQSVLFASATNFLDLTIIRNSGVNDFRVYYTTCNGNCGVLI